MTPIKDHLGSPNPAPWKDRQGRPEDASPEAVDAGKRFILQVVKSRGRVAKLRLANAFARFATKPVWEACLTALIQGSQIHLVVNTRAKVVLVVMGPDPDLDSLDILNSPGVKP
jgi:hypothetical protein